MSLTTDPNDPQLKEGQKNETGQHDVYLVLSDEERAKGFVRPVRKTYVHVGQEIKREADGRLFGWLIDIDDPSYHKYENEFYTKEKGYAGFLLYPSNSNEGVGRYVTLEERNAIMSKKTHFGGCGGSTTMGQALAETYARNPKFYGATFCVRCNKHLPVNEFVWDGTNEEVGS